MGDRARTGKDLLPLSKLTQDFIDQLELEHRGKLHYVCCECENQPKIDANAMVLFNRECPVHAVTWHRLMVTLPDGSMKLAMPLHSDRKSATEPT